MVKTVTIEESLFEDLIVQVGILKEIYDKMEVQKGISLFQKKVILQNQNKNKEILKELERVCENL